MDVWTLLAMSAALLMQPVLVYSASLPGPSACKRQPSHRMLCNNITLTEVPSGLPDTVTVLDISYNNISNLTASSFTNKGDSPLTSLYIYNNAIRSIDPKAFKSLTNLKALFLGANKLTSIHRDTFAHNTKLEELDLHGNNIILGNEAPFHNLVNLYVLNLADCNLDRIPKGTFHTTVNLNKLDMSHNKLTSIDDNLFENVTSLKFLNLSANLLISADFLLAISTTNLREINLDIHENMLDSMSDEVLKQMGCLKKICFHQNPFLCSCWVRDCSKYLNGWETYVGSCVNKTTSTTVTETTTTAIISPTIRSVSEEARLEDREIQRTTVRETTTTAVISPAVRSVNEEAHLKDREIQRTTVSMLITNPNFTSDGLTNVTESPINQEKSPGPSEASIVTSVLVPLSVIMLVGVILICVFRLIMKKEPPVSREYDSVQHEGNYQHKRQCNVCQIYQNYTPNCNHIVCRRNMNRNGKGGLNFATLSTLEKYETIPDRETEECCLYSMIYAEDSLRTNSLYNDSAHSSQMPTPVSRDEVNRLPAINKQMHPSNHGDALVMPAANTSRAAGRISTFPRHQWDENSCNRNKNRVSRQSECVDTSGTRRCLYLDKRLCYLPPHCFPVSESLSDTIQCKHVSLSSEQVKYWTQCGRVFPEISTTSINLSNDHIYETIQ